MGGRGVNIQNRQTGRRPRWERLPSSSQTNTGGDRQIDKSKLISCLMSSLLFVKQIVDTMTIKTTYIERTNENCLPPQLLDSGYRMECPPGCPARVYRYVALLSSLFRS